MHRHALDDGRAVQISGGILCESRTIIVVVVKGHRQAWVKVYIQSGALITNAPRVRDDHRSRKTETADPGDPYGEHGK